MEILAKTIAGWETLKGPLSSINVICKLLKNLVTDLEKEERMVILALSMGGWEILKQPLSTMSIS